MPDILQLVFGLLFNFGFLLPEFLLSLHKFEQMLLFLSRENVGTHQKTISRAISGLNTGGSLSLFVVVFSLYAGFSFYRADNLN